ncbi:WxL domain-containing protein [Lacticaseibacillus saniviri]
MKTSRLLLATAILAAFSSVSAVSVHAAEGDSAPADPVNGSNLKTSAARATSSSTAITTNDAGTSSAAIGFTSGNLSLLQVPSFDYGSHTTKTSTTFDSLGTATPLKDGDASATLNTANDNTHSFLHVQDLRAGYTTGATEPTPYTWKVSLVGTVPNTKDDGSGLPLNGTKIAFNKIVPWYATADKPNLAATTGVSLASTPLVDLDGETSAQVIKTDQNNADVQQGGDFYIDFTPEKSSTMTVPLASQAAGIYKSTLTWTLAAGI